MPMCVILIIRKEVREVEEIKNIFALLAYIAASAYYTLAAIRKLKDKD